MRKRVTLFSLLVLLAITLATGATALAKPVPSEAPLLLADPAQAVPNQYIVVFKDNQAARSNKRAVTDMARGAGGTVEFEYNTALHGFAATLPGKALQAIQHNPHVEYIEQVQIWAIDASGDQSGATWGIDRLDQRDRPLNGTYHWDYDGSGVTAYILDTGIRISHSQFGGRASYGLNAVGSGNPDDDHGHGTHVAGTVGGSTYGVAKAVNLVAVKVCTTSGCPTSAIVAGLDWVTRNHSNPAVANMSLGGGASTTIDNAVRNSINSGVFYAIAAGNSNANTCNYSPARVAEALTVGAATSSDARSSFSNYGSCVDIFAPGSSILSSYRTSDTATATMSGTSMAAPHATGVGALVRQANPNLTPAQVINVMVSGATSGRLSSIGSGSPNLLLYSLLSGGPSPTSVPPTGVPPTSVPPTGVPPTSVPPTGVPPTSVPPTGVPPTSVPPTSTPSAYQAENATLGGGVTVDTNHAGFLGTGFVNFPASGGFVEYRNVDGGTGGSRTLQIRFALGVSSSRTGQLVVNGSAQNITFQPTGAWTSWSTMTVTVTLNAGTSNTIRLQSTGQDLANLDQMTVGG